MEKMAEEAVLPMDAGPCYMVPATVTEAGKPVKIVRISGRDKTRTFLAGLGFTEGSEVTVMSKLGGNVIFKVKNSRIAIDADLAKRIFVR